MLLLLFGSVDVCVRVLADLYGASSSAAFLRAEIVASKPLSGLKPTNLHEFHRRVVYFERGETSLRDKVGPVMSGAN